MPRSTPVDGFSLTYDRYGTPGGPAVLLLHGWPGDRHDWRAVLPRLGDELDVIVPDQRGFGESDKLAVEPVGNYDAAGQARAARGLLEELGLRDVVVAGYDVGSRVAQRLAHDASELISALVLAPPLPGAGDRVLEPDAVPEFWYQTYHRLELPEALIDGRADAVRAYLAHFWSHWSGPGFGLADADLDRLAAHYAPPGAFLASIAWYRSGAGMVATSVAERPPAAEDRLATPTTVLWPSHDPLFPQAWGDRLHEFLADVSVQWLDGVGHFVPLEAPDAFAAAIRAAAGAGS